MSGEESEPGVVRTLGTDHPAGGVIVVGVDGSAAASAAAGWAADEAVRRRAGLRLVHGYLPWHRAGCPGGGPNGSTGRMRERSRELLERVGSAVAAGRELEWRVEPVRARPADALRRASGHALLLVVGTGDPVRTRRRWSGSVASAIAAAGAVPVAVIQPGYPGPQDGPVVVGVDGSRLSDRALGFALEEASFRGVELVAVHAWRDRRRTGRPWSETPDPRVLHQQERALLGECLAGWAQRYPDVVVRCALMHRAPSAALLDWAPAAQLIVVGSRGRGRLAGLVLGSVVRTLVNRSRCPVVVVRQA